MSIVKSMLLRGMVIYFIMTIFRRPTTAPTDAASGSPGAVSNLPKGAASNLFSNGTVFDLYVYLSEDPELINFNDSNALIWNKNGLVYGDWYSGENGDGTYTFTTTLDTTEALQNNGSIYLHTFIVRDGKSPDPATGKTYFKYSDLSVSNKLTQWIFSTIFVSLRNIKRSFYESQK